ncbi:hypothetical protein EON65_36390 [archaeon]|nr:MAG: hypothetical protein EON65_36390 [archaeon]
MCLAFFVKVEQGLASQRIVLSGGNINLPHLSSRYTQAIRTHVPAIYNTDIHTPVKPELAAYYGMYEYVTDHLAAGSMSQGCVSKQVYEEWGHDRVNAFFEKQYL